MIFKKVGALHAKGLWGVGMYKVFGRVYSYAPKYGENGYQYTRSLHGYNIILRSKKGGIMKKNVFLFIISVFLFFIFIAYCIYTKNIFDSARQIVLFNHNKNILVLSYQEPLLYYGSGNKILYIYNNFYILIGKCRYGEFPLKIGDINNNDIELLIEIPFSSASWGSYKEYTIDFIKKNKKIGKYDINYKIITKDEVIYIKNGD